MQADQQLLRVEMVIRDYVLAKHELNLWHRAGELWIDTHHSGINLGFLNTP